jgi:hypothetical protein
MERRSPPETFFIPQTDFEVSTAQRLKMEDHLASLKSTIKIEISLAL